MLGLGSLLPPDFGLLHGPQVGVIDRVVLAGLDGRHYAARRQHGILLVGPRVVLSWHGEKERKQLHISHHFFTTLEQNWYNVLNVQCT